MSKFFIEYSDTLVVIDPYIVDFACFEAKLIVEADDGQHMEQVEHDAKRTEFL